MNKSEQNYVGKTILIEKYAKKMGITLVEAEKQINGFISLQKEILLDPQYDGIKIIGLYTVRKKENKGKLCHHPITKEPMMSEPNTSLKLDISGAFKKELNK